MWREPPVRTNGATPFSVVISYFAIAGSNPYTSRIERSLDGSMLSISILYESYVIRSIMASARVLSPPQICWYHSLSRNCEQKIVDETVIDTLGKLSEYDIYVEDINGELEECYEMMYKEPVQESDIRGLVLDTVSKFYHNIRDGR